MNPRGDFQARHPCCGPRLFFALPLSPISRSAAPGSSSRRTRHFRAGRRLPPFPRRVAKRRLPLQPNFFWLARHDKAQRPRAQPSDRTCCNFDGPNAIVVHSKFAMNWPMCKSKCPHCAKQRGFQPIAAAAPPATAKAWRHGRLLDNMWPSSGSELIENCQRRAVLLWSVQRFHRRFLAFQVAFHQHLIQVRLAARANLRRIQQAL